MQSMNLSHDFASRPTSVLPVQRHIGDKRKVGQGASASKDGGTAASFYAASKVEFPADLDRKLSFVKVGESGRVGRSYTNCCQSQVTNAVGPTFVAFTTNFIRNDDGSPYVPSEPVWNVMVKYAFDPSAVKDPKHDLAPFGLLLTKFLPLRLSPFEPSLVLKYPVLFPPSSQAETVPITWE